MPSDWLGLLKPGMTAMIRCGENSLTIYCVGVLLSFVGSAILSRFSAAIVMQIAIVICGIAIMSAAASLMTVISKHDRPGPKLF
jgi:OpgC protein